MKQDAVFSDAYVLCVVFVDLREFVSREQTAHGIFMIYQSEGSGEINLHRNLFFYVETTAAESVLAIERNLQISCDVNDAFLQIRNNGSDFKRRI